MPMEEKPFKINFEAYGQKQPEHKLRDVIESFLNERGVHKYIEEIYEEARATDAYYDLLTIKNDFDRILSPSSRVGQAFMDGSIIALDSIIRLDKKLVPQIHEKLVLYTAELTSEYLSGDRYDDPEYENIFLGTLRNEGASNMHEYNQDYYKILHDVSQARGYTMSDTRIALDQGCAFMLEQARWAYKSDLENFTEEVNAEIGKFENPAIVQEPVTLVREIGRVLQHARKQNSATPNQ